jgi:NADPH:quinone reductase-like Zn-dependent oxidoreductase
MKAVLIRAFGGPEVMQLEELPMPEPRAGEVLVKVHAASVNPVDWKTREGKYPAVGPERLPLVLGRDIAGTVERCGPGVSDFRHGDAVFAMLDRDHGGYAEYVIVRATDLVTKPERIDFVAAAAVPLAGITAWQGLFDHGRLQAGQRVLIHGAAGGVGHLAVQLAKARGARVSAVVAAADTQFAHELGADQVIDYEHERFEDRVRDVDLVFDLVNGETQERSWSVLRRGGTMISTLKKPSEDKARSLQARSENYQAQPSAAELDAMARLIEQQQLRPHVERVYPLGEAREAQRAQASEHLHGKVVLQVG